jgi:hypothetical protein
MNSNASTGFIAIYRWRVAPEHEADFRNRWREVTRQGLEHGSFGSCLGRDANQELVAIALWPTEAAREEAFHTMSADGPWPPAERVSEDTLQVLDDLWKKSPFQE